MSSAWIHTWLLCLCLILWWVFLIVGLFSSQWFLPYFMISHSLSILVFFHARTDLRLQNCLLQILHVYLKLPTVAAFLLSDFWELPPNFMSKILIQRSKLDFSLNLHYSSSKISKQNMAWKVRVRAVSWMLKRIEYPILCPLLPMAPSGPLSWLIGSWTSLGKNQTQNMAWKHVIFMHDCWICPKLR